MTFLEIVVEAINRAGVREQTPVDFSVPIVADMANWVADEYRYLQVGPHAKHWWWRKNLDQTMALSAGVESYALPAATEDLDWRTLTVYTTARTDETFVYRCDYYEFRDLFLTRDFADGRPRYIARKPDDSLVVAPTPDQAYTLKFDSIKEVDELNLNLPTDTTLLPENLQWLLVWGAVKRFAQAHEDGSKLAEAQNHYKPLYDTLMRDRVQRTRVVVGRLWGRNTAISTAPGRDY